MGCWAASSGVADRFSGGSNRLILRYIMQIRPKGTLLLVLKSSPHDFSGLNKSIHSREAFCPAFALCRTCEFLLARPTGLKTKRGILWFQQCVALGVHSG